MPGSDVFIYLPWYCLVTCHRQACVPLCISWLASVSTLLTIFVVWYLLPKLEFFVHLTSIWFGFFFETVSHSVGQAGLCSHCIPSISVSLKFWDYRHGPPCLAWSCIIFKRFVYLSLCVFFSEFFKDLFTYCFSIYVCAYMSDEFLCSAYVQDTKRCPGTRVTREPNLVFCKSSSVLNWFFPSSLCSIVHSILYWVLFYTQFVFVFMYEFMCIMFMQ